MSKRIGRTVQSDSAVPRSAMRLRRGDVLYAAVDAADAHSAPPLPTAQLQHAAEATFGADAVTRVTSWRAWRASVRDKKPGVLVVLAHTQRERGETKLQIGRRSFLARADVSEALVRADDGPSPVVVLMACSSAQVSDPFGNLPGSFTAHGAAAVVGTLTKLAGRHGARAAVEVLTAIAQPGAAGRPLSACLTDARRALVRQGTLLGLLLVAHGDVDVVMG
ncbi:MAG TPA: hypothetical protein PKV27_02915, partial [Ilumatobacteraceae bacterium]|nr:hypothetical protein [Ilumatobacteraceae bacterium]